MDLSGEKWWDERLAPASKRFLAGLGLLCGVMSLLVALMFAISGQWRDTALFAFIGAMLILDSRRRLRKIADAPGR
jgi:hypothetical protein